MCKGEIAVPYDYVNPDSFGNFIEEEWSEDDESIPEPEETRKTEPPVPEEKKDRSYEMYKTGEFFKIDRNFLFYLLRDGKWNYCPAVRDVYFEASSDYWEINYDPAEENCPGSRKG